MFKKHPQLRAYFKFWPTLLLSLGLVAWANARIGPTQSVPFTTKDIGAGKTLAVGDFQTRPIPRAGVDSGAIVTDTSALVGVQLRVGMVAGRQITCSDLIAVPKTVCLKSGLGPLDDSSNPSMEAYPIPLAGVAVGLPKDVKAGDYVRVRVTVNVTLNGSSAGELTPLTTPVPAAGQRSDTSGPPPSFDLTKTYVFTASSVAKVMGIDQSQTGGPGTVTLWIQTNEANALQTLLYGGQARTSISPTTRTAEGAIGQDVMTLSQLVNILQSGSARTAATQSTTPAASASSNAPEGGASPTPASTPAASAQASTAAAPKAGGSPAPSSPQASGKPK